MAAQGVNICRQRYPQEPVAGKPIPTPGSFLVDQSTRESRTLNPKPKRPMRKHNNPWPQPRLPSGRWADWPEMGYRLRAARSNPIVRPTATSSGRECESTRSQHGRRCPLADWLQASSGVGPAVRCKATHRATRLATPATDNHPDRFFDNSTDTPMEAVRPPTGSPFARMGGWG